MSQGVCVVAGVGPGNGASFSHKFASAGYTVVMLARNKHYLDELQSTTPGSHTYPCDVSDPDAVREVFARIRADIAPVDVLIYNAGAGEWSSVEDTTIDGFESSWRTNTLGLLVASQQVIPDMKKAKLGSIIVIGATASLRGGANTTGFASAKAAQRSLSQSLARGLGPEGIHVSYVIIDGVIDLKRTRARMPDKPDDFFLDPNEIAECVFQLTQQARSAWTFELDLRPHGEKW
ncbi:MAG: SDR family NAD(P)-dependent oxidoreductase [Gammaproteobacteria bacterium]|nr:SDR family NAD(P)-dependent oxidoreductase [Gammaproteobacteria bacterium]